MLVAFVTKTEDNISTPSEKRAQDIAAEVDYLGYKNAEIFVRFLHAFGEPLYEYPETNPVVPERGLDRMYHGVLTLTLVSPSGMCSVRFVATPSCPQI
jgi:hypothetical protein